MRGYQEEFTFASMSRIPKGSLLKVSVLTCKIFGVIVVLIFIVMKTYTWTTDFAKITIKLPQEYFVQELELKVLNVTPKNGAWDTIWAKYIWVNNKIEYL